MHRGTGVGVLVVHASTIGASDESFWANTERKLPGSSFLQTRAKFGSGSAVASAPWAVGPGIDSDQLRREVKLHLPYFNLADGARSTDASLLVEVVVLNRASKYGHSVTRPDDDEYPEGSSSSEVLQTTEVCQQGHREVVSQPDLSKILAVARLDVQTALIADFSRDGGALSTPPSAENNVVFNVAKTKGTGATYRFYPELPDSIPVSVKLSFSKPVSNATAVDEQPVEWTMQRAGHEHDVPAFFVVATTLFDCAKTMKEAELRVYIRNGDTGTFSKVSSGVRGEIVVHESFEWNISADLSTMFADAQEAPRARRGATLIVALVDRAATNNERSVSRQGRRRDLMRDKDETAVGVLELSCEQLVSCGSAGRWRPLRACLSSTHQGRHGCVGRDIVGEALVAFAWMPRGPATNALPKAPADQRLRNSRKRPRNRNRRAELSRHSQANPSKNRAEEDMNNSIGAHVRRSHAEPGTTPSSGSNNRGSAQQQETLVHFHVWDALLPVDRPDSAFYVTVRLSCRGSRVQRTSTKPARGRGGLPRMSTTAARGSDSYLPGENTSIERRSSAGFMHVVWDEHLLLRVKSPVEDGAVVELVLRDASVDDETVRHACREGEPFQAFAERLGLEQASATQCSSTSFDQLRIPSPVVYRLQLMQYPRGLPEGGVHASASTNKEGSAARNGVGFGVVEVRMAGLVVFRDGMNADADEDRVEAFLRRKADVARIPGGVKRRLNTVGGESGVVCFLPMLLQAQGSRRPAHRRRLLDLSAANGLFHQFAESETGGKSGAVETVNTDWSSPRGEAGGNTLQSSGNNWVGSMERFQSSSEPILTEGGLGLITEQYFPRLAQQTSNGGTEVSQQSTARCSHPAAIAHQDSFGMSFAGFVSWLRNVPQDDLGTAGLLVSPRTALQKTGRVMDEDAQGLAAALQLAREPTPTLIGGWCSIPHASTIDSLALDRVRIGWGQMGGGGGGKDGSGAEESEWRRHTELLQRDVAILRQVLAELEQRCGRCGNPTVRIERENNSPSTLDHGLGEVGGADADANGSIRDSEQVEQFADLPPTGDTATVAAYGDPAAERNNSECCSVAALYFGQEAARLGSAADHLKEALRCAGDALTRSLIHTPDHQGAGGRFSQARTDVEKDFPPGRGSSRTLLEAIIRSKPPGDGQACYHHRCYGLLLQHIKQVTAFQIEIAALQSRAATIAQQTEEKTKPQADSTWGQGCCSYSVSCDTELPRSALALVKRIRRSAQNAARLQQLPEPLPSACDVPVAGGGGATLPMSYEQVITDGLPFSPIIKNRDSSGECDAEAQGKQLQQDRAGSPPPAATTPVRDDGGASPQTLASPRAPFIDILRGPVLLQIIERRLEDIRSRFDAKCVDLPATFSKTSADRVLEIARGVGQGTGLAPLAALCCPIDRFALHVFRTAGAAEEGGSSVFTSVQELAGMGGLETHATENSLWTAAAQAGIVDVERWVVAAVLWQVTNAVATANARVVGPPHIPRQGSMGAVVGEGLRDGLSDNHAAVALAEATSLWKELRDKAFSLVLGLSSRSCDQDPMPTTELGHSSTALSSPSSTAGGQEQREELLTLALGTGEDEKGTEQHPRETYNALQSDSSSFDLALVRTLALTGRGDAGPGPGAATQAGAEKGSGTSDSGSGFVERLEIVLLHNFVIAGFADASCLDVSDIVDAVSVRRQRILSAAAAAAAAASEGRYLSRGTAQKDADNLVRSSKNQHQAGGPPLVGGPSQDDRHPSLHTELPNGEAGAIRQTIRRGVHLSEGGGGSPSDDDAAVGVPTEPNVEASILAGIPIELRELFRAAAIAKILRQQQHQQKELQEVSQGGSAESDELAAEQRVSRILDSNRTLESAPFSVGRTALHHAAARGDDFLVRLLLERGCQPHLKDFEGNRACDLTRDLKCLRLLGALKKAPEPSAVSLRTSSPGEPTTTASSGEAGDGTLGPPRSSARAMTRVEFAVSFRLGKEEAAERTSGGAVRIPSETPHVAGLERGEEVRADIGGTGTAVWVEGVARSYDVRNKMLFIDANDRETYCSGKARTGNADTPAGNRPGADEKQHGQDRTEEGQRRRRSYARHVLDVRLLSCVASQGEELFDQLRAFSGAFETGLVRSLLDVAIDAAANIGAVCREAFDEFVDEIMKDGVATEAYRNERLAIAAEGTATAAVGSVLRAAQRAVILARRLVSGRAKAARGQNQNSAAMVSNTGVGDERLKRVRSPTSNTGVAGEISGESSHTISVDKSVAARMCFRCTAVVTERWRKVPKMGVSASTVDTGVEDAANLSSGVVDRKRHDLQYLTRWTIQGGLATVVVRGSSYLNAVAAEKRGGAGCRSINLEGRDAGMERMLVYHGVSLPACLQTFDVMQDMEDPSIVLDMLAAGICQLSTRYAEEGIEFSSLCRSDQDALQADVRSQLYHAAGHGAGAAPEWDELSITMQAYGGVTSVGLKRGGDGKPPNGGKNLVVSAPTAGGWFTPEEAAAALRSPPPSEETASSPLSSSPSEPLPPSAVDVVLALMRSNPCEVLGSLSPGIGVDGRISLIGQVYHSDPDPTSGATKGGKDKHDGGGYGTGEGLLRERHRRDGEEAEIRHGDKVGGSTKRFRCSVEVAWDKDEGGVFVQRFGIEPDERRPRFNLRAVGIRGFSVTQLPVSLEDIDDVWDQAGSDLGSHSGASTVSDRPLGSTSSSSDCVRSSEGGQGGVGGEEGERGKGTSPQEQAAVSTATSVKATVLERAEVATAVAAKSATASETAAQVTPSASKTSDKSSDGDGEDSEIDSGSSDSEAADRRSGERSELMRTAAAAEVAADFANPGQSSDVVAPMEDRYEADGPVQGESNVEDKKHASFAATRTNEQPVSQNSIDKHDEGRKGQQDQEKEYDIDQQTDGSVEAESMGGGNEEGLTFEQDQKDGPGVGAAERVEPTVGNDDADVLLGDSSEGHAGAEMDQNNDVGTITAAERVDDSGAVGGGITMDPAERVEDTPDPDAVLPSDPDKEVTKHPAGVDASRGMPVEDRNGDVGESSPPRETRSSSTFVDRTRTASTISQGAPLAAGGSEQDSADIQDVHNAGDAADLDHSQRLEDEKVLEKETREREQNVEGQAALGHAPGEVGDTGADHDNVDTSPVEVEGTSVSREGGVEDDATDGKNAPLVASRLWEFPPSFGAQVTLSTAENAVECTVEGEIAPELNGDSHDKGTRSWRSIYCVYKIAAGKGGHPSPQADIDLEDDEAQARLEDLLEREYGLAMEDVLELFSLDTDLGSGEAVLRSFTDSICQLRPSLLVQPQNSKGEEDHGGGDRAVYKAVGAALRGGDEGPEWREMQVRVGESHVVEVGITSNTSSTTTKQRGQPTETEAGDNQNSEPGTGNNRVVDCSGVASPEALSPHLLSEGVPALAVDALERAGFVDPRSVVDLAGVLAALAQEAENRKSVVGSSSPAIQKDKGERKWPGVDPDRDETQLLRLTSGRQSRSWEAVPEYRVAVTGSSERFKLEISPVLAGDDDPPASVALTTVSCLRPLGSPAVIEKGLGSETQGKSEPRENSSARTPQPEDASSRIEGHVKADTAGLNVGDKVEARFDGKTEWFPGTVRAINAALSEGPGVCDGEGGRGGAPRSNLPTVAIDYDDGDVEERVPRVRVRLPGQKQPRFLNEGDEVDVKRGKKISLARIVVRPSSAPKEEGHYDLQLLDDGRRGVGGGGALVENCPRSAMMALHGWPPARK